MGKKKNGGGQATVDTDKVFCYFCDKDFDDERVLIQHQVMKHFRCPVCKSGSSGKCNTLHGLIIHYRKVHSADLAVTPNSIQGRDNPVASMQIVGTRFVPEEVVQEWRERINAPQGYGTTCFSDLQNGENLSMTLTPDMTIAMSPALMSMPLDEMVDASMRDYAKLEQQRAAKDSMAKALKSLPNLAEEEAAPAAGESDLSAQVAAWMQKKKEQEDEERREIEMGLVAAAAQPPMPSFDAPLPGLAPMPSFGKGFGSKGFGGDGLVGKGASAPSFAPPVFEAPVFTPEPAIETAPAFAPPAFTPPSALDMPVFKAIPQMPIEQPAQVEAAPAPISLQSFGFQATAVTPGPEKKAAVQDAAASFLGGILGNLAAAKLGKARDLGNSGMELPAFIPSSSSASAPPAARPAAAAEAPKEKSRSRGKRSKSRKRSRSRAAATPAKPTFESRTINITGGAVGTRLWLKMEMEKFGRVEVCHTGNRNNPVAEPPWVRFEKMSSVETALTAIAAGAVLLDGVPIKAEVKQSGRPAAAKMAFADKSGAREERPARRDLEITSRDLARDDARGARGVGGGGGRESSARDDIKSRSGPGNYSSRDLARDDQRNREINRQGPGNYSSRDLARDDTRGRQGPGNYSSRDLARDDGKRRNKSRSRSGAGHHSSRDLYLKAQDARRRNRSSSSSSRPRKKK